MDRAEEWWERIYGSAASGAGTDGGSGPAAGGGGAPAGSGVWPGPGTRPPEEDDETVDDRFGAVSAMLSGSGGPAQRYAADRTPEDELDARVSQVRALLTPPPAGSGQESGSASAPTRGPSGPDAARGDGPPQGAAGDAGRAARRSADMPGTAATRPDPAVFSGDPTADGPATWPSGPGPASPGAPAGPSAAVPPVDGPPDRPAAAAPRQPAAAPAEPTAARPEAATSDAPRTGRPAPSEPAERGTAVGAPAPGTGGASGGRPVPPPSTAARTDGAGGGSGGSGGAQPGDRPRTVAESLALLGLGPAAATSADDARGGGADDRPRPNPEGLPEGARPPDAAGGRRANAAASPPAEASPADPPAEAAPAGPGEAASAGPSRAGGPTDPAGTPPPAAPAVPPRVPEPAPETDAPPAPPRTGPADPRGTTVPRPAAESVPPQDGARPAPPPHGDPPPPEPAAPAPTASDVPARGEPVGPAPEDERRTPADGPPAPRTAPAGPRDPAAGRTPSAASGADPGAADATPPVRAARPRPFARPAPGPRTAGDETPRSAPALPPRPPHAERDRGTEATRRLRLPSAVAPEPEDPGTQPHPDGTGDREARGGRPPAAGPARPAAEPDAPPRPGAVPEPRAGTDDTADGADTGAPVAPRRPGTAASDAAPGFGPAPDPARTEPQAAVPGRAPEAGPAPDDHRPAEPRPVDVSASASGAASSPPRGTTEPRAATVHGGTPSVEPPTIPDGPVPDVAQDIRDAGGTRDGREPESPAGPAVASAAVSDGPVPDAAAAEAAQGARGAGGSRDRGEVRGAGEAQDVRDRQEVPDARDGREPGAPAGPVAEPAGEDGGSTAPAPPAVAGAPSGAAARTAAAERDGAPRAAAPHGAPAPEPSPGRPAAGGTPPARHGVHDGAPVRVPLPHVGDRPPGYEPEPTELPGAPAPGSGLDASELGPDTVLDGARYGGLTVRAASVRGDSPRYRGEPRRDALLVTRLGEGDDAVLLLAVAAGVRTSPVSFLAARDACAMLAANLERNRPAILADLRRLSAAGTAPQRDPRDPRDRDGGPGRPDTAAHPPLQIAAGFQRLVARTGLALRRIAEDRGIDPADYATAVRCLLVPVLPDCRTRVFFGVGGGALLRLRDGAWEDLEPPARMPSTAEPAHPLPGVPAPRAGAGEERADPRLADYGEAAAREQLRQEQQPPADGAPDGAPRRPADEAGASPARDRAPAAGGVLPTDPAAFRFRVVRGRPGDALLLGTAGMAGPLGEEPVRRHLADCWAPSPSGAAAAPDGAGDGGGPGTAEPEPAGPPGLADFLRQTQIRVRGHAADRTAAVLWDAPRPGGTHPDGARD